MADAFLSCSFLQSLNRAFKVACARDPGEGGMRTCYKIFENSSVDILIWQGSEGPEILNVEATAECAS